MSSSMEFAIWLTMFAPVIAVVALLLGIAIAEIEHKAEEKYMNDLIHRCVQAKGYDFVHKVLDIAKNSYLSKNALINLLETACNVEHKKTRREKLWDGLRTMQNSITAKVR